MALEHGAKAVVSGLVNDDHPERRISLVREGGEQTVELAHSPDSRDDEVESRLRGIVGLLHVEIVCRLPKAQ
jgi:hypothetical protein